MVGASTDDWMRREFGHAFRDPALLVAALTHRSASSRNNERLEFLGDAVLNLVVAERLFHLYPAASEGDLSRLRARVVSAEPLAEVAQRIGLGEQLQLGSGELKTGGFRRQSIVADALEALIGAVYLDAGLEVARALVLRLLEPRIASAPDLASLKDSKTRLQEYLQARSLPLPCYTVESVEGEPHDQHFRVECRVDALSRTARGEGKSRRRAEQEAAQRVLEQLDGGAST
jgi:ribonuclease-3